MGYNSASLQDNCGLFAPSPLFSAPGYAIMSFKFPGLPWIWISMDISIDISMCGYEIKAVLWIYPYGYYAGAPAN